MKKTIAALFAFVSLLTFGQTTQVNHGGTGLTSTANHDILVGTGPGTYTLVTVPDCQDTSGNHLNFTQSSNSVTCGTSSSTPASSVSVNGSTVTSPNFNDTTPAAASNNVNVTWQQSSGNVSAQVGAATSSVLGAVKGGTCTNQFLRGHTSGTGAQVCSTVANTDLANSATTVNGITCSLGGTCTVGGSGLSGTNVQTGNYTLTSTDNAKLVVMNCSAACTATLYGSPSSVYFTEIISIGSIQAAISLNSKTYNGGPTAPTLNNQNPLLIWSDGTNYYGNPIGNVTDLQARRGGHGSFVTCAQSNNVTSGTELVYCFTSYDGLTWQQFGNAPAISQAGTRDPSIIHYDGKWWMAVTYPATTSWQLYSSSDLVTWTGPTTVSTSGVAGVTNTWAPHFFIDSDSTVHVYVTLSTNSLSTQNIYEMHPTARDMSTWSTPSIVSTGFSPAHNIDPNVVRVGTTYYMFFKDDDTGFGHNGPIDLATSTSATGTFTITQTGNWAGWQNTLGRIEAPQVVQMDNGKWRIYFVNNNNLDSLNVYYSETTDSTFATGWSTPTAISTLANYNHPVPIRSPSATDLLDSSGFLSQGVTPTTGVIAGSCGDATHSCSLTIDAFGRVTNQTNNVISGGGSGDYALLATTTTTGSQSSVTFSSISSSYTDLVVKIRGRGTNAVTNENVLAQFNSDTAGNYQFEDVHWFSTAGAASQSTGQTSIIVGLIPGSSATANYSGTAQMTIGLYSTTTFYKQTVSTCGVTLGTGTFSVGACLYSGAWANTAAINAVKIFVASGGFVDGTIISIYGVK